MTGNDSLAPREPSLRGSVQRETLDLEQDETYDDHGRARHSESKSRRICVLLGSAILQLPIWGKKMTVY